MSKAGENMEWAGGSFASMSASRGFPHLDNCLEVGL
jgi:hypothetical protein